MSDNTPLKRVKAPEIELDGKRFLRIPIKTQVIMFGDDLDQIITDAATPHLQEGDTLFVTEKIVAISQGRAYPLKDIQPRPLAKLLSNYVTKTPAGIGLGMPETMEMALRECGIPRILFAAFMSALTKPFGKRGVFYDIAGYRARSIDGPTPNTLPPYNQYVVLGPDQPDAVAQRLSKKLSVKVAVVDINDIDGCILGASDATINRDQLRRILKDNPLGQNHEQTPIGIIRLV